MCGLAGILNLSGNPLPGLRSSLEVMNRLQSHRGPDGSGIWEHHHAHLGFAHRRLSIIDIAGGLQPMADERGNWLIFNGEIYNYIELREQIGRRHFQTKSDTEVILRAYGKWGEACVDRLRGMFAFALWDEAQQQLFCARDRFGVKPFYYTTNDDTLYFASEVKALLPFLDDIRTNPSGLMDYLTFQLCLEGKTLFEDVEELLPGHVLVVKHAAIRIRRYWEVYYQLDFDHTESYFVEHLTDLLENSVAIHQRSDVPIGGYLSGGLDSTIIACLASTGSGSGFEGFTGKFSISEKYDESRYAREVAQMAGFRLHEIDIASSDFINNIRQVIYHLDYPVAGPGSFAQFMVSGLASGHRKVVLGGEGADEIFGGYVRYLIAYFEQCIKAAINGTGNGECVVTYESIIPNLKTLREYKPLLQEFWREGLFGDLDSRYFRLINRAPMLGNVINWNAFDGYSALESFHRVFRADNVGNESYFDRMTHFDFKTLLPALLHVEDRVSMAHGVESRVPFLDHPLVEFAATIPSNIKFKNGAGKHILRSVVKDRIPRVVLDRTDKMGFPVPLSDWFQKDAREFVRDVLSSRSARDRDFVNNRMVVEELGKEPEYGRKLWGLLSLELWQQEFHDKASGFRQMAGPSDCWVGTA